MEDILFRSIANTLQHFNVPSDDEAHWLDHNSAYLSQSISQFPEASRPFATTIVQGLFPRLNLFCYASLLNVHNDERLSVFHKLHNRWSNTSFTDQLPQYQSIKEVLVHIISFNPLTETLQSAAQDVMHADIYHMALRLIKVIEPETESRRQFFTIAPNIVPAREQNLIDLFQSLLIQEKLKASHSRFLNGLLKLSKKTGLFPRSLIHNDVVIVEGTSAIAGGSFGDIWRGRIVDQPVALKVMRVTVKAPQKLLQNHRREAIMWSQFNHPNVLPFYGIYCWRPHEDTEGERMALLSPWMENGNAIEYLAINPKADRAGLVLDIAQGLEYLHNFNPPFIHGDLKGNNILITSAGRACLADFGLSKLIVDSSIATASSPLCTSTTGNELFTAPEILFGELDNEDSAASNRLSTGSAVGPHNSAAERTMASDVYSFGCVCYEIFTGKPRFCEIMGPFVRMMAIRENKPYPQPPLMLSSVMWEWTNKCWATRPNKRPTIREFLTAMDSAGVVAERVPEPPQTDICSHLWDNRVNPRVRSNTFQLPPLVPPNPPEERRVSSPSSTSFDYYATTTSTSRTRVESPLSLPKSFSGVIVPHPPPPPVTLIPLLGPEHQFRDEDIIIAVMGATGTGKSTYINDLMGSTVAPVGNSIDSCTNEIQIYGCEHLMDGSRRVFIVDTPGFDRTKVDDRTTLHTIATWLERTYRKQVTLSGILYFFDIGASRVTSTGRGNMSVFKDLCGAEAFNNVIMLTIGWEDVENAPGVTRERDFKTNFLGDFLSKGGRCHRYRRVDPGGTCRNAWDVVDMFDAAKRPLLIQVEMVKHKKKFTATSAFKALLSMRRKVTRLLTGDWRS
ncbi:kinase-like protein [Coprinopsis marcescibilis]|uniref:Kinase-like protein n=1 Tax=Coprinopsis marcescibilis TaxID=230819 RepID=A0A5C3KH09_COPMA|nr:kinase-like protein [Coprinopsis marcescibilis]